MIRGVAGAAAAAVVSVVTLRAIVGRGSDRLLHPPRTNPEEAHLGPSLDALGGEVVRIRSRDGLRLSGRWLEAEGALTDADEGWTPDPHEAVLLLHGWSGSVAPDLVDLGPFLRRTAGVLGLDLRGHGESDEAASTFGLREVEDVAGGLAWLGDRGIERVAFVGSSMGGITAIASVVVLGDGSLPSADMDPSAPAHVTPTPRPRIVAVVADSVTPTLEVAVASRLRGPARSFVAARLFDEAVRTLGADPRSTEPIRMVPLLEGMPLLLIHGDADRTVPITEGRRLAAAAPPGTDHWVVPGADHGTAHSVDPVGYESRVTDFLRRALSGARGEAPIIAAPEPPAGVDATVAPAED